MIGNESGQVHILDNGELKNTLTLGTQTIGAVAGFSRGFIAGCGGTVHVYEYIQVSFNPKCTFLIILAQASFKFKVSTNILF